MSTAIIRKKCKLERCSRVFFYSYKYRREFCCPEHRYEYHFPKKPCKNEIQCKGCDITFKPDRPNQKYHNRQCALNHLARVRYRLKKTGEFKEKDGILENQSKCAIEDKLAEIGLTAAEVREMTK